jgi:cobalt-zinc-cadmium efflux system membrane fusion protein
MKFIKYLLVIMCLITVHACSNSDTEVVHDHENETNAHGHDHEPEPKEDEVHLLQKQMDVMNIHMGKFQFLNLSTTVKSNGKLQLPPQNKASVSALVGGRVKSIDVLEGDFVKKGQVLARLEHPDFIEMQEQYMTIKSQLAFSQQDFERQKALNADSISSLKSFQKAESEYNSLRAKFGALEAKMQLFGVDIASLEAGNYTSVMRIRTPINGYVRSTKINMGMSVLADQSLFEIVDNDHIHIDLNVYEKDMLKIKKGQKVIFAISNNRDSVFEGNVFALGRAFEEEPKAMVVHAEIDNHDGNLLSGMYVDARIVINNDKVKSLPNDAIVSDGGLHYIFVLKPVNNAHHSHDHDTEHNHHSDEFVFRKIEVNTGASDIGFTEVVPAYDLPENAEIVTSGAFYLLAEMKKGEGGHGHHH